MGLLDTLFKKKSSESVTTLPSSSKNEKAEPILSLRGKPDSFGLYPSELIMLSTVEKYKTTDTVFPKYLTYDFEIINPVKMIKNLKERGFIEEGGPKDGLSNCKLTELKYYANSVDVSSQGSKTAIIKRLSELDVNAISNVVKDRSWKLTDKGRAAIKASPYISFFLDKHAYDVREVGVNIWTVNEDYFVDVRRPYRDIIFRQIEKQMNESFIAYQTAPLSGIALTHKYCNCLLKMSLFVEEEKKYDIALYFLLQHIYSIINIDAATELLVSYHINDYDKKWQEDAICRYYEAIKLYPFQRIPLLRLIDELNMDSDSFKSRMASVFKKADIKGVMTEDEAALFIIYELNGETDKSMEFASGLARTAVKRLRYLPKTNVKIATIKPKSGSLAGKITVK